MTAPERPCAVPGCLRPGTVECRGVLRSGNPASVLARPQDIHLYLCAQHVQTTALGMMAHAALITHLRPVI